MERGTAVPIKRDAIVRVTSILQRLTGAALGLAFFGGGVFWAMSARPGAQIGFVSPVVVGWLAGIAGVGFFVTALFLLLERVGRAAEREPSRRR